MMELDLNELERLAEAATQGPWIACGPSFGAALPKYLNEVVVDNPDSEEDGIEICQSPTGLEKESSRDMEFIAAANPAVVLELVRRLREAERLVLIARPVMISHAGPTRTDDFERAAAAMQPPKNTP